MCLHISICLLKYTTHCIVYCMLRDVLLSVGSADFHVCEQLITLILTSCHIIYRCVYIVYIVCILMFLFYFKAVLYKH